MSGKVTVTKVRDWLTPYQVEVAIDGRPASTSRFSAGARAQTYALKMAEAHDLDMAYDVDLPRGEPRRITAEEFAARVPRICAKCRESKPIAEFRTLWHTNQHTARGQRIPHGWADRCLKCEAET